MARRQRCERRSVSQRVYNSIIQEHARSEEFERRKAGQGESIAQIADKIAPVRDPGEIARAANSALRGATA